MSNKKGDMEMDLDDPPILLLAIFILTLLAVIAGMYIYGNVIVTEPAP